MIEVGRLCVKIAGRDARMKCLVVDIVDNNYVLIDGQTRRRKCNQAHLEPLDSLVSISRNAPHDEVVKALKDLGIPVAEKKAKEKTLRPRKQRKGKEKPAEEKKPARKKKPDNSKAHE